MMQLTDNYQKNIRLLDELFAPQSSYDLNKKPLIIGEKEAMIYFVEGLIKDEMMEKVIEFLLSITKEDLAKANTSQQFSDRYLSYLDIVQVNDTEKLSIALLSGMLPLLMDGFQEALIIDARHYPTRAIKEPEDDKVIRGAHEGFVETIVLNTAMIRRRIRNPQLRMQLIQVGTSSHTDLVLAYLNDRVDHAYLDKLVSTLQNIDINSLVMSQESIAELLIPSHWYNPFPKIRYTERPDAASADIYEGKIVLIIDNSPSCMILPTAFFDFCQNTNDYYFPPIIGTYQQLIRTISFLVTLFLTPVWYLVVINTDLLSQYLSFMKIDSNSAVPIFIQLLIIEGVIEVLKLASLNTPSAFSNSFSIVAALILGDFAIQSNLFVPDVVLYMSFVAIGTFAQPSFELGYAMKLTRIFLLILITLWNIWGFVLGMIVFLLLLATQKTFSNTGYLYPLVPFNGKKLKRLFFRVPIHKDNC